MSQSKYEVWIQANQPDNPHGKCAEVTLAMAEAFPELKRVRGHYECPIQGSRPHWWLVAPGGSIVDPTAAQFITCGRFGEYIEHVGAEPTGKCMDCGEYVYNGDLFCNDVCAQRTINYLGIGNRLAR